MRRPMSLPLYALIVVTLLLSSMPPATVAQSRCPEGLVGVPELNPDYCIDPETGLPVPPEEYPTEVPLPPDEPPAPPAGNLASFTLYHLACDDDFDPNGVRDAGGLGSANGCLTFGKPPFTYTISANGIPITSTTLDATERDFARLDVPSPIPAGALTIAVAPVADYTTEFISCGLEIGEAGTDIVEPPVAGGTATLSTLPDQKVECWVYNVSRGTEEQDAGGGDAQGVVADPPEATGADITIAAYNCPAGTTAANVLLPECVLRANGLTFSLLTATETVATQTSDAEGGIYFAGVAPNDYGIAATLPAGYGEPIVICYQASPDGNVSEGEQDVVFGNQIRVRVGVGFSVECAWYNIPAQGPDNGPNIFIQARKCGKGITIDSSVNVFDAEQLCPVVYQGKGFEVLLNDEPIASKSTSDDPLSPGQVFFTKLPATDGGGAYGVMAALGEGEQTLGVFCDQDFGDGVFQIVPATVTAGNRIDQVLYEGHTLRCSWFIKINPLAPIGTQVADLPGQEAAPVETGDESAPAPTVGQDASDPVETLTEPQEGQASPATTAGDDEVGSEVSWEPGITVRARLCPADVAGQDPDVDLTGDCTEPATEITFEILVDDAPTGTYVTDANGEFVIPTELGPGQYLFRHQPAAGQLELRTVCSSVYANGSTATGRSQAVGSAMSELYLTHDGASSTTCTFYVVMDSAAPEADDSTGAEESPPEGQAPPAAGAAEGVRDDEGNVDGAPHSLTLQFWTCPAGADPAADQAALLEACGADPREQSFILTIDGLSTGETVTGAATWEFVEPTIEADIGPGLASSAWCSSTWAEGNADAAGVPDTVSLAGGALTVTVSQPATTVSCDWFLFPD